MCRMIPSMSRAVLRITQITVGLPADRAIALFAPECERRWADGWNPEYPQPDRREGAGAVFITRHGDQETTWIMVDHGPGKVRYARVTKGMTAGTVAVDVVGSHGHSTEVLVTYDLTSLTPAGERWLDGFDSHYEAAIGSWATEIADALRKGGQLTCVELGVVLAANQAATREPRPFPRDRFQGRRRPFRVGARRVRQPRRWELLRPVSSQRRTLQPQGDVAEHHPRLLRLRLQRR